MGGPGENALAGALRGDAEAARALVDALAPIVQSRVARALLRRRSLARGRDIQQFVADLTQDVFATLFADSAKVLRAWDPERGASLPNFVGLIAEREVASVMRSGRRSPWTEDPTLAEDLPLADSQNRTPESEAASRQELELIFDRLRARLSPKGLHLFTRMFIEEAAVAEVSEESGMSPEALYAWRSRLMKLVREIRQEAMSETSSSNRMPEGRSQ